MPESTEAMAVLAGCAGRETRFQPWTRGILLVDWAPTTVHERKSTIAATESVKGKLFMSTSYKCRFAKLPVHRAGREWPRQYSNTFVKGLRFGYATAVIAFDKNCKKDRLKQKV
jgi:hypothetical protein